MARRKRIKKELDKFGKPIAGGTPKFEFVDTETGEVFPDTESVRTIKEFEEIGKLPKEERRNELIKEAREREGLGLTEEDIISKTR